MTCLSGRPLGGRNARLLASVEVCYSCKVGTVEHRATCVRRVTATQRIRPCTRLIIPSPPPPSRSNSYDEKTDVYSLGMLLFEMCHPPFGTKMERTVVLTNAHRLQFPEGDAWGPPRGEGAIKDMCRSMLQQESGKRPSAADIVRQVRSCTPVHVSTR